MQSFGWLIERRVHAWIVPPSLKITIADTVCCLRLLLTFVLGEELDLIKRILQRFYMLMYMSQMILTCNTWFFCSTFLTLWYKPTYKKVTSGICLVMFAVWDLLHVVHLKVLGREVITTHIYSIGTVNVESFFSQEIRIRLRSKSKFSTRQALAMRTYHTGNFHVVFCFGTSWLRCHRKGVWNISVE